MLLLGSVFTHLLLAVTLVLAAVVAGTMAYHYAKARLREKNGFTYDPEKNEAVPATGAEQRAKSAEEIAQIRSRIESLMEQQQVRSESQSQHLAQKLDEIRNHMGAQDRKMDGIKSELRHEIRRRDGELEGLRHQLAGALDAFWKSMPALPEGSAPLALPAPSPEEVPTAAFEPAEEAAEAPAFAEEPAEEPVTVDEHAPLEEPVTLAAVPLDEAGSEDVAPMTADVPEASAIAPDALAAEQERAEVEPTAPPPFPWGDTPVWDDGPAWGEGAVWESSEPPAPPAAVSPWASPFEEITLDEFADDEPGSPTDLSPAPRPWPAAPASAWPTPLGDGGLPVDEEIKALPTSAPIADPLSYDAPEEQASIRPLFTMADETPAPPPVAPGPPLPVRPAARPSGAAAAPRPAFIPQAATPIPDAPPDPSPAPPVTGDNLTVITNISAELQQKLYAIGVTTLDEMARWSRADARRISGLVGIEEEIIMHQWIFEAQSALFEHYQLRMTQQA